MERTFISNTDFASRHSGDRGGPSWREDTRTMLPGGGDCELDPEERLSQPKRRGQPQKGMYGTGGVVWSSEAQEDALGSI